MTQTAEYNPLTGQNWDAEAAARYWGESMQRSKPRWQLRGTPGRWVWTYFNFGPWTGTVQVGRDGFHWMTMEYGTGRELHHGVTTSIFEAYQSVEQNREVRREGDPACCPSCKGAKPGG